MEMDKIGIMVAGIFLAAESICDIRDKTLPWSITVAGIVAGVVCMIMEKRMTPELLNGLLPGAIMLVLSRLTGGAIGYGDGMLVLALGLFYEVNGLMFLLMTGIFYAGIVGLILLLFFHKKGKYELPFVPFLFLGWLTERCVCL